LAKIQERSNSHSVGTVVDVESNGLRWQKRRRISLKNKLIILFATFTL